MPLRPPAISIPDPVSESEASIDPLSLNAVYERLANRILPAVTVRMSRPRFLTAIAISAAVCQEIDGLGADGHTPPRIAFEWLVIEAFVRNADNLVAKGSIPGVQKVQNALANHRSVSRSSYLKTPAIFGFTGIYRRLATQLRVVTDDLNLDDAGYRLLAAWEKDKGLGGFNKNSRSPGGDAFRLLQAAVKDALEKGYARPQRAEFWTNLAKYCDPAGPGTHENRCVYDMLRNTPPFARAQPIVSLLEEHGKRLWRAEEPEFLTRVAKHAPTELGDDLKAISDYESLCRPITDALAVIRHLGNAQNGGVDVETFARHEMMAGIVANVQKACVRLSANEPLRAWERDAIPKLIGRYATVGNARELFEATVTHHFESQRDKPPDGKRPWLEETKRGRFIVRPNYAVRELTEPLAYVHDYRTPSLSSFLKDIGRLS